MNSPATLEIKCDATSDGERIDSLLAQNPKIGSRSRAAKWIASGLVSINGKNIKPSHKVRTDDLIIVLFPPEVDRALRATATPLDIVYEDASLLVVNKPAGLVVHPATSHIDDTLVNALLAYTTHLAKGFHEQRPGIVHRLDRDTSGLLVVAKTDTAFQSLADQFRKRTIHRLYWAIVFGKFPESDLEIRSILGRHPVHRKKFATNKDGIGKTAVTHAHLLRHAHGMSLVQLKLETGRTHQIRVHLSEAGFPIVGDRLYGAAGREKNLKSVALRTAIKQMSRFALHAAELGFAHPETNRAMSFSCSWPNDLSDLVRFAQL